MEPAGASSKYWRTVTSTFKEEDVFFVLTCKQISLVLKSLGLWKRTAVSMANHLETSINGALFRYPGFIQILFHQFASEKKKEKSFGRQNGQVNIKELSLLPQDINTWPCALRLFDDTRSAAAVRHGHSLNGRINTSATGAWLTHANWAERERWTQPKKIPVASAWWQAPFMAFHSKRFVPSTRNRLINLLPMKLPLSVANLVVLSVPVAQLSQRTLSFDWQRRPCYVHGHAPSSATTSTTHTLVVELEWISNQIIMLIRFSFQKKIVGAPCPVSCDPFGRFLHFWTTSKDNRFIPDARNGR